MCSKQVSTQTGLPSLHCFCRITVVKLGDDFEQLKQRLAPTCGLIIVDKQTKIFELIPTIPSTAPHPATHPPTASSRSSDEGKRGPFLKNIFKKGGWGSGSGSGREGSGSEGSGGQILGRGPHLPPPCQTLGRITGRAAGGAQTNAGPQLLNGKGLEGERGNGVKEWGSEEGEEEGEEGGSPEVLGLRQELRSAYAVLRATVGVKRGEVERKVISLKAEAEHAVKAMRAAMVESEKEMVGGVERVRVETEAKIEAVKARVVRERREREERDRREKEEERREREMKAKGDAEEASFICPISHVGPPRFWCFCLCVNCGDRCGL